MNYVKYISIVLALHLSMFTLHALFLMVLMRSFYNRVLPKIQKLAYIVYKYGKCIEFLWKNKNDLKSIYYIAYPFPYLLCYHLYDFNKIPIVIYWCNILIKTKVFLTVTCVLITKIGSREF